MLVGMGGRAVAQLSAEPAASAPVPPQPPARTPALRLGVSEAQEGSPLSADLRQAVETTLRVAGFVVVADPAAPRDAEARVGVVGFSAGVVARGSGTLRIERGGALVDEVTTPPETYLRANFASQVAQRLVEALASSPRWRAFAEGPPQPALPAASPVAPAPPAPPGKSGVLGKGINIEGALVIVQTMGPGGQEAGTGLALIPQFDLGPRWALRVLVTADVTFVSSPGGYADISLTPGIVRRWRRRQDQAWVPYVGGGVKLGSFGAGHALLGLPAVTTSALFIGHHHIDLDGHGHADDPNFEIGQRVAPELWAGVECHPLSWFSIDLAASYAWIRLSGANLHLLRELIGLRLSF
jgi:hypothetical protein